MRHLTSDQLVDLAEGARTDESMPHLDSCAACRAKLTELREVLRSAAELDIPEPSPLFWDHLSARVHEAVEAERADDTRRFWHWPSRRSVPLWVGSLTAVVLAGVIMTRGRVSEAPAPRGPVSVVAESPAEIPILADDASLSLMADLVTGLDWDGAVEAGLTTDPGIADGAVMQLSDDERRELHQLLRMAIGRPGQFKSHS